MSASCLAAASVFFTLQCVVVRVQTQPVVVARTALKRGARLNDDDLGVKQVPASSTLDTAFRSIDEALGGVMQIDISAGALLLASMTRRVPTVPDGYTVIDTVLASAENSVPIGETVTVVATLCGASGSNGDASSDISDDGMVGKDMGPCSVAKSAIVLAVSRSAGDEFTQHATMATLAMPADEAAASLIMQRNGASLLAVTHVP